MNTKKSLKALTIFALAGVLSVGCTNLNNMVSNHTASTRYTQTPNPMETDGDVVQINIAGSFAPGYFHRNAVMIFQPELQHEGGTIRLRPMILIGEAVTDFPNKTVVPRIGGRFTYYDQVPFTPELENARLVVNPAILPARQARANLPTTAEEAMILRSAQRITTTEPLSTGVNVVPQETAVLADAQRADRETDEQRAVDQGQGLQVPEGTSLIGTSIDGTGLQRANVVATGTDAGQQDPTVEGFTPVRLGLQGSNPISTLTDPRFQMPDLIGAGLLLGSNRCVDTEHIFVKSVVFFESDVSSVNMNYQGNRREEFRLAQEIKEQYLRTGKQILSVRIQGWASPEGTEYRNRWLGMNRTRTGERFFREQYDLAVNDMVRELNQNRQRGERRVTASEIRQSFPVIVQYKGEDWNGFLETLGTSSIQNRSTILQWFQTNTDRAQRENELRNMLAIHPQLQNEILPPLRRVEIIIEFIN